VGTSQGDGVSNDRFHPHDGAIRVVRTGLLPHVRPTMAQKVAYENAQRLFGLK